MRQLGRKARRMPHNKKLVVITGAGSGIGAALATEAAKSGWRLILAGRRAGPLQLVADGLPPSTQTICVTADITTNEGRQEIASACQQAGGHINMLINNAGIVSTGRLEEMRDDDISAMIRTNLEAPICLTRDLLPFLRNSEAPRIVNIGSMFGDIGFPVFSTYSSTKFGLRGFSDALRRELAPENIGVTYAAPRAVRTPAADAFEYLVDPFQMKLDDPENVAQRIWKGSMVGKRSIYPFGLERLFVLVQRLVPRVIDSNLVKQYCAYQNQDRRT